MFFFLKRKKRKYNYFCLNLNHVMCTDFFPKVVSFNGKMMANGNKKLTFSKFKNFLIE